MSRRHVGGPALWVGIPMGVVTVAFVIVLAMLGRACSNIGQLGSSSIGVSVRNDCDRSIIATAAGFRDEIDRRMENPIRIAPGDREHVSVVTHAAYEPEALFVAVATVGADQRVVIREFDADELEHEIPRLRFAADCVTLSTIED